MSSTPLFDAIEEQDAVRCPDCGFCPREESPVETRDEELDCFEVGGMDDGLIMCPQCAAHIRVDAGEAMQ